MATKIWMTENYVGGQYQALEPPALLQGGTALAWWPSGFRTSQGTSLSDSQMDATTVAGPTSGIDTGINILGANTGAGDYISDPISADVTISGTITFNVWAMESSMSANAAINARVFKIDGATGVYTEIAKSTRTTELGTTRTAQNWTVTPTSTAFKKGDRIAVRLFIDDSTSNMGAGFSVTWRTNGTTAGADGDSFVSFTETFSFDTITPTGTQLFLTNTAGPAVGSDTEYEMWTSRGGGVTTATKATGGAGPISPLRLEVASTPIEWYTRRLEAVTLSGTVKVNGRAKNGTANNHIALYAELHIVENDGSNPVLVAKGLGGHSNDYELIGSTEAATFGILSFDDTAVAAGQRLRLRLAVDDGGQACNSETMTFYFNGTSGGASGDAWLQFSQTLTEFTPPPSGPVHIRKRRAARFLTFR